jgi:hypothetical protein
MHTYEKRGAKKKERRVGELLPTVSSSPTEYTYEKRGGKKKKKGRRTTADRSGNQAPAGRVYVKETLNPKP